jgi:hypothetical protein
MHKPNLLDITDQKKISWISEKHQKLVVNQSSQSLFSDGWLASCALKKRGALQVSYYRAAACTRIASDQKVNSFMRGTGPLALMT